MAKREQSRADDQPASIPRLTLADAISEIADEWIRADRGLPRTLWRLSVDPSRAINDWIERRDKGVTRPFRYLVVMIALAALLWLGDGRSIDWADWSVRMSEMAESGERSASGSLGYAFGYLLAVLTRSQPEVLIVLCLPLLALGIFVGGRFRLNLAESWVVALYASAQGLFAVTLLGLLQNIGLGVPGWGDWTVAALVWLWTASAAARGAPLRRLTTTALIVLAVTWTVLALAVVLLLLMAGFALLGR